MANIGFCELLSGWIFVILLVACQDNQSTPISEVPSPTPNTATLMHTPTETDTQIPSVTPTMSPSSTSTSSPTRTRRPTSTPKPALVLATFLLIQNNFTRMERG